VELAGEPGILPVIVSLAVYRIVEEALDSAREGACHSVSLALHFYERGLVLRIAAQPQAPGSWPTMSMQERIGLCGGELRVDQNGRAGSLTVRLPRQPHGGPL
jgi:signal transduction histidine kinase